MTPSLIAICGNVGSGKTTLARNLSSLLNWQLISVEEKSSTYLSDLFQQPRRWSFEVQMSYLTQKAVGILSGIGHTPMLLDRALEEDIEIFAAYWAATGALDSRAFELYREIACLVTDLLPAPDAYIFCDATSTLSESRLAERSRSAAAIHSTLDVDRLAHMYLRWWENLDCPRKLRLDSEKMDFRSAADVTSVASLLVDWGLEGRGGQMELLPKVSLPNAVEGRRLPRQSDSGSPQIYLAGPFSGVTVEEDEGSQDRLFAAPRHVISRSSPWRGVFEETARALEHHGWAVFLPHRDVSRWGSRTLTAQRVAEECLDAVRGSEVVLAVPGLSHGTHVEVGVALGRRTPTVLVQARDLDTSFFTSGLAASPAVGEVAIERLSELPKAVSRQGFKHAVERAIAGARSGSQ